MPFYTNEQVLQAPTNLRNPPTMILHSRSYTIGDIHGNSVLMLYFLLESGALTLDRPDDYQAFYQAHRTLHRLLVEHYNAATSDALQQTMQAQLADPQINQQVTQALAVIDDVISRAQVAKRACTIRFVGDMLADRGPCDYATLLLLEKLKAPVGNTPSAINLEILFSNHDEGYVKHLPLAPLVGVFQDSVGFGQEVSLQSLLAIVTQWPGRATRLNMIIDQYYIPNLHLFSYSKNHVAGEPLRVYSHAPNDYQQIFNTIRALVPTIQNTNDVYQSHASFTQAVDTLNAAFHRLYAQTKGLPRNQTPQGWNTVRNTVWRRGADNTPGRYNSQGHWIPGVQGIAQRLAAQRLLAMYSGCPLQQVHGHDGIYSQNMGMQNPAICLNGNVGKGIMDYVIGLAATLARYPDPQSPQTNFTNNALQALRAATNNEPWYCTQAEAAAAQAAYMQAVALAMQAAAAAQAAPAAQAAATAHATANAHATAATQAQTGAAQVALFPLQTQAMNSEGAEEPNIAPPLGPQRIPSKQLLLNYHQQLADILADPSNGAVFVQPNKHGNLKTTELWQKITATIAKLNHAIRLYDQKVLDRPQPSYQNLQKLRHILAHSADLPDQIAAKKVEIETQEQIEAQRRAFIPNLAGVGGVIAVAGP